MPDPARPGTDPAARRAAPRPSQRSANACARPTSAAANRNERAGLAAARSCGRLRPAPSGAPGRAVPHNAGTALTEPRGSTGPRPLAVGARRPRSGSGRGNPNLSPARNIHRAVKTQTLRHGPPRAAAPFREARRRCFLSLGGARTRCHGDARRPPATAMEMRAAVRRREQEERDRRQWESYSRSFARAALCCSAQARWSESSPSSRRREAAERLEQRRERLRELLGAERDALEAELREERGTGHAATRERCAELKAAREGRRRTVAQQMLRERWKRNCAELRELESEMQQKHVVEAWDEQLKQKQQQEATEREEREYYENEYEMARREALERMRREEEQRQLEEKKQAEMLLRQIEELKLREAEATKLKKEQDNLLKQQWELESLEEERKQMEEHRKKTELGRFLRQQCNAQLKRRAQQIQEELETDRQILLALLEKEDEDQRRRSERRERAVADVAWMRRVIEEQLQLEKEREAELQIIFREEARKVWEKREEEWEREKRARDRLMKEVLAGRQRQIQEKMELNRRAQEESIKQREQLIKELEEAKELARRAREHKKELKAARRQELEAQLTERRRREQEEQQRQREEEEEERSHRQRCVELVQQERHVAQQGSRDRSSSPGEVTAPHVNMNVISC
ncbi:trichoplein keratin filament-binding protein [Cyrtonyx montezumae]|uniref:trichoplein keratin filament-binding protein n=1 Tax=Cyrtonyx montezumae TaxID=9017 RepID=UPI0032DB0627